MKFKMRVLHYSPAGNAEKIGSAIARAQQCNEDRIPPAYPIENEKLIFIGVETKKATADKDVVALCQGLNTSRTKNVAFYAVGSGPFTAIDELKQIVASKDIQVAGSVHECQVKGGLFKKGGVSDEDVKAAVAWAEQVVDSLV